MRPIKFRIFEDNEMEYDVRISGKDISLNDSFKSYKGGIMQYTGLTDKNGKEIYDGDIIRQHYPNGASEIFVMKFGEIGWYLDYHGEFEGLSTSEIKDLEVIGNIHENPELLNKEEATHEHREETTGTG